MAHGNSVRWLLMHLDGLAANEIAGLSIPTGILLAYRLTAELRPIEHRYLAERSEVVAAVARVVEQGRVLRAGAEAIAL